MTEMTERQARILIVDDDPKNSMLLEVMLKHEGYVTLSANSGTEALAMVAQQPPDLILLDIMMPGVDGYDVASTLTADPATRNIPIIMVTALHNPSSRRIGRRYGVVDFITKPVDRVELYTRVRNLLRLKEGSDLPRPS